MKEKPALKKDVKKLLAEQRAELRASAKRSLFMRRTASIYRHQALRAKEMGFALDYTLADLRALIDPLLGAPCVYCGDVKVTAATMAADHAMPVSRGGSFSLDNLVICCASCNYRKGKMSATEYHALGRFLAETMPAEVMRDIRTRLTVGGKWAAR